MQLSSLYADSTRTHEKFKFFFRIMLLLYILLKVTSGSTL